MKFKGTWINNENQKSIRITGPNNGDVYILEYDYEENKFLTKETIQIFKSNAEHAHLPGSDRFDKRDIEIIDADKFRIGEEVFVRDQSKVDIGQ